MHPTLQFPSRQDDVGFENATRNLFAHGNATAPVRELIQNAIDAAPPDGQPTHVSFTIRSTQWQEIPEYLALQAAIRDRIEFHEQYRKAADNAADQTIPRLRESIASPQTPILIIADNGHGVDDDGMQAMLAEGGSSKGKNRSGSYGLGNLANFTMSDAQYVLYASRRPAGDIAAGKSILASGNQQAENTGPVGYLRHGKADHAVHAHHLARNSTVPPYLRALLDEQLQQLRSHTGTVIIITAFNNFYGSATDSLEQVHHAVAKNFMPAVINRTLRITTHDEATILPPHVLDLDNIKSTLRKIEHQVNKKAGTHGLSGAQAALTYQNLTAPNSTHPIHYEMPAGPEHTDIHIKKLSTGDHSRVLLFRNHMYITDNSQSGSDGIPIIYRYGKHLAECKPFHAVLNICPTDSPQLHQLLRAAENPAHTHIMLERLANKNDRAACETAFRKIGDAIANIVGRIPPQKQEAITDFLTLNLARNRRYGPGPPEPNGPTPEETEPQPPDIDPKPPAKILDPPPYGAFFTPAGQANRYTLRLSPAPGTLLSQPVTVRIRRADGYNHNRGKTWKIDYTPIVHVNPRASNRVTVCTHGGTGQSNQTFTAFTVDFDDPPPTAELLEIQLQPDGLHHGHWVVELRHPTKAEQSAMVKQSAKVKQ